MSEAAAALQPPHGPWAAEADEEDRQAGIELGVHVVLVHTLVSSEQGVLHAVVQALLDGHNQACHSDDKHGRPSGHRGLLPDVEQYQPNNSEEHVQSQVPRVTHACLRIVPREDGAEEEEFRPPCVVAAVREDIVLESGRERPEGAVRRD
eukprot:CAMPEP_0175430508 /NCGR_PEP_ID=MMETSP0095-20121207/51901_1 /TAXON_ID=311494 /ORGANISM="Alexandrium monilatum, Strain CCMP3105" /LENGTH=149 /DNA_ID=CAMNT_0016729973 /DNA_START=38 /DNA_END=488 /DNA_ORIENTATION=-